MANVFFYPAALKDFKQLSGAASKEAGNCLKQLSGDIYAGKPLRGPLRGFFVYKFNTGGTAYRIAYEIVRDRAAIIMIASRDNFYKKFSRRAK